MAGDATRGGMDAGEFERELDRLQEASRARQAELRDIAAALPQVTSRRVVLGEMGRSVAGAPDRIGVLRRTAAKIARTPVELLKRSAS